MHLQTDARSTRHLDTSTCSISKSTVQNPTGFHRIEWFFLPAGLVSHPFWMKILIGCQVYTKWSTEGAGLYNKLFRLQYGHLVSLDSLILPLERKIMLFLISVNGYSFFFNCSQLNFCLFVCGVFCVFGVVLTVQRRAYVFLNELSFLIYFIFNKWNVQHDGKYISFVKNELYQKVWPGILPGCDYIIRFIQRQ